MMHMLHIMTPVSSHYFISFALPNPHGPSPPLILAHHYFSY